MIVQSPRTLMRLMVDLWVIAVPLAAYIGLVTWLDVRYHFEKIELPAAILVVPGTVIGLLLAFRTNSCYGRWWEARTIWGAIVNDSRTWTRQLLEFVDTPGGEAAHEDAQIRALAYRQSAWCYALTRSLRKQNPLQDVANLLDAGELELLAIHHNVSNAILGKQGLELHALHRTGRLELFSFVELERTLTRLTDAMGACERIKNTTFPTSYSYLVRVLLYLFIMSLPFGMVALPPSILFCTSLALAFSFLVIDRAADFLQDPFENLPADTPMLSLSRTIEINIKQMLGEQDLPEKIKPVDGILY